MPQAPLSRRYPWLPEPTPAAVQIIEPASIPSEESFGIPTVGDADLVVEFESLDRTPYSLVTVERWLPEWSAQISGLSPGKQEQYAHGHSVSVAVDGNGAGEDIIFRARSGSWANPNDHILYVAVIKGSDLDDPTLWDNLWVSTGSFGVMRPAWTANSGSQHGGSVATTIWDDAGTLKGRAFWFTSAGQLRYVDVTLSTGAISAVTTIDDIIGDSRQLASMQLGVTRYDEVFVLLNQLVESSLAGWHKDVWGTFIRRYYDSGGWQTDDSFHLLTHAEGGLVRDTPLEGGDFGDTSHDLLAQNWEKRGCGGLAVTNIDDNTVVVSLGMTHWRRWGYDTHSQGLRSFVYHRDSGWWGQGFEADRSDFTEGARLAFSTFAKGFEIEGANFISWNRSCEPSDFEQQYNSIAIPRIEEVVYAKLSANGKHLTQFVHLGDQDNLTAAAIIALNHSGAKQLYAIGWRSVYESPPAAFLCSVPSADRQDLADYALGWSVSRNNRQGMAVDVTLEDPSIVNTTPTIVKAGALARVVLGNPTIQTPVGQGFMETDRPSLEVDAEGNFAEGATANFRADDLLLNTRAETIEDVLPQKVIHIPPEDPVLHIQLSKGVWGLDRMEWPTTFFPGSFDALQNQPCWRLSSFPFAQTGGDLLTERKGTWFKDITWLAMDPMVDGAIETSVRFGDPYNQANFSFDSGGTTVYATLTRNNGVITQIQWRTGGFGGTIFNTVNQSAVMGGLLFHAPEVGRKYNFVWEYNANFAVSSHTDDTWTQENFDRADYSSHGTGFNRLYLIVTDYDGNNWVNKSVQSITTGLTLGQPADLRVQVLGGTIHCYYRAHSTGTPNQWRLAFTHKAGRFGAGRFGLVGRGHGGLVWQAFQNGIQKIARTINVVDFWNINLSNAIEDTPMEDHLRRYAWRGYTETEFRPLVEGDSRTVAAGSSFAYADLLENPVLNFKVSIPASGNEAGVYLRGVDPGLPTDECIKLGLVPHSTPNSSLNPINYYAVKRRFSGGAEVTTARAYSPIPIQLLPGKPVPVRVSVQGPVYSLWIAGNYVGHFVDETALGLYYGFYAEGGTATFSEIYVPELYEVTGSAVLEANQAMNDAIKKVIGRRRVRAYFTPDGKLKFSYFLVRDPAPNLHENYYWRSSLRRNPRYLSKVRVQGSNAYAIFQSEVLAARGQRYEVVSNAEIQHREFAYREAQKIITEIAEQQLQLTLSGLPDPRLNPEAEAIATISEQSLAGGFVIVDVTINFNFGEEPKADMTVNARQQVAI